ncbi:choline BCCT transporter BetT [Oceanimonas doudoroffii]|uniref:High-affinity choline transporter BetT n=1 Tax=Oceanimonas doudoroffii TaxID=84158 RepID=A0A233RGW1_9GAMM|nr:choline BCCT transporter BetT [Oceanimonas doudoroffii]OXY82619.1 high-affinity choline transporter BetT [Oceanimonas doudoroffii]
MTDVKPREVGGFHINSTIFYGSLSGVVFFLLYAILYTDQAAQVFSEGLAWVNHTFGWYYMLATVAYLVFILYISLSRFGKVRLGTDDARPEFSLISWAAMLFAAGIGIDVLFFSVAEPLSHYLLPPELAPESREAIRHAVPQTFFHWGLTGWAMYALMGAALAYFSYRHKLPLAIRSTLFPLLGKRINGPIGYLVDIAAVIGTVFGIATSLGIGVMQLNYGLGIMFGLPENLTNQVFLIIAVVIIAAFSAMSGVDKGIRRLSEVNMLLATGLLLFVLYQGNTLGLLDTLVLNIGDYVTDFVALSFNTYALSGEQAQQWKGWWTVFFWSWWIAWTPFIGMFLARISKGRTLREFAIGALLIPLGFMIAWMSVFGNSGIELVASQGLKALGEQALNSPQSTIYTLLEQYPYVGLTTAVVLVLAVLFFVTSADSGALVLANFTSVLPGADSDAPAYLRALWAAIIGAVTIVLLLAGGLNALQSVVVIAALPFSLVLFASIAGLYKALAREVDGQVIPKRQAMAFGEDWRQRLHATLKRGGKVEITGFLNNTVRPAVEMFAQELRENGKTVTVEQQNIDSNGACLTLKVQWRDELYFVYEIRPQPLFLCHEPLSDTRSTEVALRVFLAGGKEGSCLAGYQFDDVLHDLVFEFEHFVQIQALTSNDNDPGYTIVPDGRLPDMA